ncbi:response regulator [Gemmatimonadota bacterium]
MVKAEFSEWNNLFLYAIRTFQDRFKDIQRISDAIQEHERKIEIFLDQLPEELKPASHVRQLPKIWERKFLIVDDTQQILELLVQVFNRQGHIETAVNGREALEKTKDNFFNVILSDIDMPLMNGLEFFNRAREIDPDVRDHFIFITGNVTSMVQSICTEHHIPLVQKPFSIDQIMQAVQSVVEKHA